MNVTNFSDTILSIHPHSLVVTRTQEPIRPNDVNVLYVEVAKAMLTQPELIVTDNAVERDFSLLLSTISVTYTVRDCGNGLEPLVGYYGNRDAMQNISVEQVRFNYLLLPKAYVRHTCTCSNYNYHLLIF